MNDNRQYEKTVVINASDVSTDEQKGLDKLAADVIRRAKEEKAKSCHLKVTLMECEIQL